MAERYNLNRLLCIFAVSFFVVGESQKWGKWSEFGACQGKCGTGFRVQSRLCVFDPDFDNYDYDNRDEDVGDCVVGQVYELEDACDLPVLCPVDGGWGNWSEKWSECESVNCSSFRGYKYKHRSCTNPVPRLSGKMCQGPLVTVLKCKDPSNCPIDGNWTSYSRWECSIVDGQYIAERKRNCTNPKPKYGGQPCEVNESTDTILRNEDPILYDKGDVCREFMKENPPPPVEVNKNDSSENPDRDEEYKLEY